MMLFLLFLNLSYFLGVDAITVITGNIVLFVYILTDDYERTKVSLL